MAQGLITGRTTLRTTCTLESDATPRRVTPLLMLDAIIFACSVDEMATVPPLVNPLGIVTVPALVEIVPEVLPLFAMEPVTDPEALYPTLPVSTSADVMSPSAVSKN